MYRLSQFTYGLETLTLNTGTKKYLNTLLNNLIRQMLKLRPTYVRLRKSTKNPSIKSALLHLLIRRFLFALGINRFDNHILNSLQRLNLSDNKRLLKYLNDFKLKKHSKIKTVEIIFFPSYKITQTMIQILVPKQNLVNHSRCLILLD
ncbi:hypothetical protein BpHYR1_031241 [Brachionus plicatilis]|uniref:RNA-directed DNA polymerase from mobile element jockey-like n=1 Tax=Brachionus plicatilis TaxID=10195 RepID=A0A3M7RZP8_BRAPC|nr:hypothetical protein BpHYR1_031241 [Brachionus plicatilis]